MKHLFALIALAMLASCSTLTDEQRQNINQTGSLLAKKAAAIAGKVLLNSAVSAFDEDHREDFLHSAAQGLREEMLNIVTAQDVRDVVAIWTPDRPAFDKLADDLAKAYAKAKAEGTPPAAAVESVAVGLQSAAL